MKTDWKEQLNNALGAGEARFWPIVGAIRASGGRALVVGGWLRDLLLGEAAKDVDVEVYGIAPKALKELLAGHGEVEDIGEAFGILKLHGLDVDFSIPRRESKAGLGHKGFEVLSDPAMTPEEAGRRRDLTVNSMALDLETGEIVDPFGGTEDLRAGRLDATDPAHFVEDPLRVYRVAQFAARFEFSPTPELVALCAGMEPEGLPLERILGEFDKLLLKGRKPSLGLAFLKDCSWIRYHPELQALIDCPQDEGWHPEGDAWTHSLLAADAAVLERTGEEASDRLVAYGALCHDLGKPACTGFSKGRIRSLGHSEAGEEPARRFLAALTREHDFTEGLVKLVLHHMAPTLLHDGGAGPAAIRRLARKLEPEVNIELLVRVARADSHASGPDFDKVFEPGEWLMTRARELAVEDSAEPPALMGRHLIAAGLEPGPEFGRLLRQAYEIQTDEGVKDPDMLLARVLSDTRL